MLLLTLMNANVNVNARLCSPLRLRRAFPALMQMQMQMSSTQPEPAPAPAKQPQLQQPPQQHTTPAPVSAPANDAGNNNIASALVASGHTCIEHVPSRKFYWCGKAGAQCPGHANARYSHEHEQPQQLTSRDVTLLFTWVPLFWGLAAYFIIVR